jgi:hypothetical protein
VRLDHLLSKEQLTLSLSWGQRSLSDDACSSQVLMGGDTGQSVGMMPDLMEYCGSSSDERRGNIVRIRNHLLGVKEKASCWVLREQPRGSSDPRLFFRYRLLPEAHLPWLAPVGVGVWGVVFLVW